MAQQVHELPADWRARLRQRLLTVPDHRLEYCRSAGLARESAAVRARLRASWTAALKAGQISFPGGRLEAHDADVAAAAMRETEEEIGIAAAGIEPIGFLPDHVVQTGYRITPVVALLNSPC